jgi:alpha-tubulin suppressor-like RCC1 family protein
MHAFSLDRRLAWCAVLLTACGARSALLADSASFGSDGAAGTPTMDGSGRATGDAGDATPPVGEDASDLDRGVLSVTGGNVHTCAMLTGGHVKCWGDNLFGQLGLGDTRLRGVRPGEMGANLPAVDLGTGHSAIGLGANAANACALLDDHSVKCWGDNASGQLGLGDGRPRGEQPGEMGDRLPAVDLGTGRTAKEVAVGEGHSCVILDDQTVKCWGFNRYGQLGLGDTVDRGDGPGQMGDSLPVVRLGSGRLPTQIAAGGLHTCALFDGGAVKCWGSNGDGELGIGDTALRGDSPGEMGDNLPAVDLGSGRRAMQISAGLTHTCALLDDGHVKCWGTNSDGQLGLGDTRDRGIHPGEMGDALPPVDLGPGRTAVSIAAGFSHTCAILDDGTLKCWGDALQGELGQGDQSSRGDQPGEMGSALSIIDLGTGRHALRVSACDHLTCAVLDDHDIKCWGGNTQGQLGIGDTADRGNRPGTMGDALPEVLLF